MNLGLFWLRCMAVPPWSHLSCHDGTFIVDSFRRDGMHIDRNFATRVSTPLFTTHPLTMTLRNISFAPRWISRIILVWIQFRKARLLIILVLTQKIKLINQPQSIIKFLKTSHDSIFVQVWPRFKIFELLLKSFSGRPILFLIDLFMMTGHVVT